MIAIRLGTYLSLMLLMGLAAFPLYALIGEERLEGHAARLDRWLKIAGGSALLLSALGMVAMTANMMGTSYWEVDAETVGAITTESAVGWAWVARMGALLLALAALVGLKPQRTLQLGIVVVASGAALASLVWTGHAGASEDALGVIHKLSDMLHMLAAAIWIGGIVAFLNMLRTPADGLRSDRLKIVHRALGDFSVVGTLAVAVIAATGLINGQVLVGYANVFSMFTSLYGQLLLAKLVLVGLMLLLAAKNRWRLTPGLTQALAEGDTSDTSDTSNAVAALRRSLLLEATAAFAILALVAWLGMLEPTASLAMP